MVYQGGRLLGTSDAFADKIKCPKGAVTVRLLVRHKDEGKLRSLKDLVLVVSRDAKAEIDCYSTFGAASIGGDKFKRKTLKKGASCCVFLSPPPHDKLPKGCKAGDVLRGQVTYEWQPAAKEGDGKR